MPAKESIEREHQFYLERPQELKPAFLNLRNSLTESQQALLDSCIALCEALTEAECQLHLLCPYEQAKGTAAAVPKNHDSPSSGISAP